MESNLAPQMSTIVKVTPLVDMVVEAHGFRPDSLYVE